MGRKPHGVLGIEADGETVKGDQTGQVARSLLVHTLAPSCDLEHLRIRRFQFGIFITISGSLTRDYPVL